MKKMKLNLEELKVQSFNTGIRKEAKGTVLANATIGHPDCENTKHYACTDGPAYCENWTDLCSVPVYTCETAPSKDWQFECPTP